MASSPPTKKRRREIAEDDISKPPGFRAVVQHWEDLNAAMAENREEVQGEFDRDSEAQNARARDPDRNARERLLLFMNAVLTAFREEFNEFFPFIEES
jgi:hypothetical protein